MSVRSFGIVCRLGIEAKIRSISMPLRTSFMMGTKESGTGVNEVIFSLQTFSFSATLLKISGNNSKKSSRVTCLGATARVSMSEPSPSLAFVIRR